MRVEEGNVSLLNSAACAQTICTCLHGHALSFMRFRHVCNVCTSICIHRLFTASGASTTTMTTSRTDYMHYNENRTTTAGGRQRKAVEETIMMHWQVLKMIPKCVFFFFLFFPLLIISYSITGRTTHT
jgi:hypothetical protein